MLLIALALGLYRAKTEAGADRARLETMQIELAEEHQTIRILRNEVGELESPERLRTLAEERLGLVPLDPQRVVTLADAPQLIAPEAQEGER
jgi:hypothetical protein